MMASAILAGWSDFLSAQFLGNAAWRWVALLGIVLTSLVMAKMLSFFLLRQADRLAKVEGWVLLELVLRAVDKPVALIILAGALYLAEDGELVTFSAKFSDLWSQITRGLAIIAGGWLIYRLIDVVEHFLQQWTSKTKTQLDDQLVPLIRKSLRVFIVIVVVLFVAENVFRWNIGSLLAGLGIGGLALALASKDALSNLFGSVTIFADRPFQMGERIKIRDYDGTVEEVGFRSSRIRTLQGHLVTIPNSIVANEPVENIGRRPTIKRVLNVSVTYDTSPAKLQLGVQIIREMLEARKDSFPADCPPRVYFSDFNADNLNIVVYYWFSPPDWWQYLEFNHEFNMELLTRFNEEGIEFAFPTQTVYVKKSGEALEAPDEGSPRKGQAYT